MALLARFLLGSCNGMLGSVKVRTISIENMVDVFMHLGEFFTFRGLALVLTDQRFVEESDLLDFLWKLILLIDLTGLCVRSL